MKILNPWNLLSLLRGPLAFLFLIPSVPWRTIAIALAMLTDSIDGYLARRSGGASQFGAILDPVMDKFFVFFGLTVFVLEGRIEMWQACAMISRDFFLIFFGIYLGLSGLWQAYQCKSVRWGKISTALQFIALIALTLGIHLPWYTYSVFILFGGLALKELSQIKKDARSEMK